MIYRTRVCMCTYVRVYAHKAKAENARSTHYWIIEYEYAEAKSFSKRTRWSSLHARRKDLQN